MRARADECKLICSYCEPKRSASRTQRLPVSSGRVRRLLGASAARTRKPCQSGNDFIDPAPQFRIERVENRGKKMTARFRESTGDDHATKAGSPSQQGKERLQSGLYRTLYAGAQESNQIGQGQVTPASEIPRVAARRFEEKSAPYERRNPIRQGQLQNMPECQVTRIGPATTLIGVLSDVTPVAGRNPARRFKPHRNRRLRSPT